MRMSGNETHPTYRLIPQRSWDAIVSASSKTLVRPESALGLILTAMLIEPEAAIDYFDEQISPFLEYVIPSVKLESLSGMSSMQKAAVLETISTWIIQEGAGTLDMTQVYKASYRLGVWIDADVVEKTMSLAADPPRALLLSLAKETVEWARRWALGETIPWRTKVKLTELAREAPTSPYLMAAVTYLATNLTASDDLVGVVCDIGDWIHLRCRR